MRDDLGGGLTQDEVDDGTGNEGQPGNSGGGGSGAPRPKKSKTGAVLLAVAIVILLTIAANLDKF